MQDIKKMKKKKQQNKWKSLGVEPILYKIKNGNNHSLLYDTVREMGRVKENWLSRKKKIVKTEIKHPLTKESDKETAESVISLLKTDEKLAKYFPEINLSSDPEKKLPVDISWLKAFSETESSLLKNLTRRTTQSQSYPLWKPLSLAEENVASWLHHHLDKKELNSLAYKTSFHSNRFNFPAS